MHLDITGKFSTTSIGGSKCAIRFVDDRSGNTDIYFIEKISDLFVALNYQKERSENVAHFHPVNLHLYGVGENMGGDVKNFAVLTG